MDPDPEGPKTRGSGGSGSATMSVGEDPALARQAVRIRRPSGGARQEAHPRGTEGSGGGGGCYQVGLWLRKLIFIHFL
jgi:hypothetical protein